jgi:outer membrane protein
MFDKLAKFPAHVIFPLFDCIIDRIRTQLIDIIKNIGKKDGFLLIMEKNQAGVLYSPSTVDITEKVIRLYNQKVEK